jgi:transposase
MRKSRRKYDAEFKRQAVQMVLDDHRSCRAVEKALGVGQGIVYRWLREAKSNPQDCFPGNGRVKASEKDVVRLVREIEQLRRERDILKKALGIFSQTGSRSTASLQPMSGN